MSRSPGVHHVPPPSPARRNGELPVFHVRNERLVIEQRKGWILRWRWRIEREFSIHFPGSAAHWKVESVDPPMPRYNQPPASDGQLWHRAISKQRCIVRGQRAFVRLRESRSPEPQAREEYSYDEVIQWSP